MSHTLYFGIPESSGLVKHHSTMSCLIPIHVSQGGERSVRAYARIITSIRLHPEGEWGKDTFVLESFCPGEHLLRFLWYFKLE